jgi:hypothetical protein
LSSYSSTDSTYKKLVENPRSPQRVRIATLKAMSGPPLAMMMRLERDPDTPPKVKLAVAQRRAVEMLIRKIARKDTNATMASNKSETHPASNSR